MRSSAHERFLCRPFGGVKLKRSAVLPRRRSLEHVRKSARRDPTLFLRPPFCGTKRSLHHELVRAVREEREFGRGNPGLGRIAALNAQASKLSWVVSTLAEASARRARVPSRSCNRTRSVNGTSTSGPLLRIGPGFLWPLRWLPSNQTGRRPRSRSLLSKVAFFAWGNADEILARPRGPLFVGPRRQFHG